MVKQYEGPDYANMASDSSQRFLSDKHRLKPDERAEAVETLAHMAELAADELESEGH